MPIVHVTRHGRELTISHPNIELRAGESVEWRFKDLDIEEMACVHFEGLDYPESEPYGPFQCLEPSSFDVRGLGNTGRPGHYRYTAFVLSDQGVVAKSDGHARVVNCSTEVDTSPDATIHFDGKKLHVKPHYLKVDVRRPAVWYITGLPAGYFITFHFDQFHDEMVGPFSSFQVSRGLGTARVATGANFTGHIPRHRHNHEENQGYKDEQKRSPIHYHVRLRRPDGSVVAWEDPVIEPPPGWIPGDDVAEP
ncbi:MAG TPA: hypothetical protein VJ725_24265 [Thermoanaerobaculia bacterium]|nr:hypothetical protein [Thermoanaerobaculia bacterium]